MSLDALAPFARRRARDPEAEACELCAAPLGERHAHVVDLSRRAIRCACATCARLFAHPAGPEPVDAGAPSTGPRPEPAEPGGAAGRRFRTVPDRVLHEPGFAIGREEWSALQIPVGLAFVFFSSAARRWIALYPSPAGAMESELPLDAWRDLAARSRLVASAEPDVEALLVHHERGGELDASGVECLLVPIDACFGLVGRIRRSWRGLDGGDAVRREVAGFLAGLRARARPVGSGRGGCQP